VNLREALLWMILVTISSASASAQNNAIEKFGLYVIAADLNKSREFYEKVFQKPPYVMNDRLVGFDIAGGLYAIVAAQSADQKLVKGNNTVPYVRVKDAELEFARVKSLVATLGATMIDSKVVQEGPIKLFRFADPDGNVVEFFSLVAPPPK
jgi:predicted enzyme related to lactoylglutathione lyase